MSKSESVFREKYPFIKRQEESSKIKAKYPDRIPIICEVAKRDADVMSLDKTKYLIPQDLTASQFLYVIRKRLKINAHEGLYLFVNNQLPPGAALMSEVYKEHKDEDGFLYLEVSKESTFG